MGFMLPYIAAPWILWEYVPIKIHGKLQDPFHLRPLTERHSAAPMCLISKLQWVVNQHCPFRLRTGCDRTGLGSQSRKPSCRFWGDENLTGSVWLWSFKVQFPYVCATRLGASRGGSMVESNSWRYVPLYIYLYIYILMEIWVTTIIAMKYHPINHYWPWLTIVINPLFNSINHH
jgi:hypothetical protein